MCTQWLKVSNRGLDSLIWQTEWKTAPLAKIPKCRSKKLKPNFGSSCYDQLFVCQLCVQRLARVFYFWLPCMIVKLVYLVLFRSSTENLPGFPGVDTSLLWCPKKSLAYLAIPQHAILLFWQHNRHTWRIYAGQALCPCTLVVKW